MRLIGVAKCYGLSLFETITFLRILSICQVRCEAAHRYVLEKTMARRCELTGKDVMTGNNVSHAKNRTRRRFLPNLCAVNLQSETLGQKLRLRVSANALRTVEHRGGLDAFLLKARDGELSLKARRFKRRLVKAQETVSAEA